VQPEELALSPVQAAAEAGAWFDAMFRDNYPRLVAMLTRLTGDRGQAEEIADEAFAKLARRSSLFATREEPAAWVYRVATNAGLDALRARARRKRSEAAAGVEQLRTTESGGALEDLIRTERAVRVRAILAALKPREAQLLLLRSSGQSYREIAETLGVQAGSVGTLLARAEREFERRYRARYGDDL